MSIIFHVDLDAFYASVEELENPELAGKPLLVGGSPDERGVVASANYEARSFKARPGMTTAQALRRCPNAALVPPRIALYRKVSKGVTALLRQICPVIETFSIDEAFLDMTDLIIAAAAPAETARSLQEAIQNELGLSASIGIAANKLTAKMASAFEKPRGITVVSPGSEAQFLALLPVRKLWGVGPKAADTLAQLGITTIGQLAHKPEPELVELFGSNGALMWRHAHGIDRRPLEPLHKIKSLSRKTTFSKDVSHPVKIEETLQILSNMLAYDLQRKDFTARTISLKLRYSDFSTLTRNITRDPPTNRGDDIYRRALLLLHAHWNSVRPLRMVGLSVRELVEGVQQLSFWVQPSDLNPRSI